MNDLTQIRQTFCRIYGEHIASCQAQTSLSLEMVTQSRFFPLVIALIGTLVGGFVTYAVQSKLRKAEQRRVLEENLTSFLMTTVAIKSDMDSVRDIIGQYRAKSENKDDVELWRIVHKLHFTPFLKPDFSQLRSLTRFKNAKLMEDSMYLFREYQSVSNAIHEYNSIKDKYLDILSKYNSISEVTLASDAKSMSLFEANMNAFMNFIDAGAADFLSIIPSIQKTVFDEADRKLGSADFLRLHPSNESAR